MVTSAAAGRPSRGTSGKRIDTRPSLGPSLDAGGSNATSDGCGPTVFSIVDDFLRRLLEGHEPDDQHDRDREVATVGVRAQVMRVACVVMVVTGVIVAVVVHVRIPARLFASLIATCPCLRLPAAPHTAVSGRRTTTHREAVDACTGSRIVCRHRTTSSCHTSVFANRRRGHRQRRVRSHPAGRQRRGVEPGAHRESPHGGHGWNWTGTGSSISLPARTW